MKKLISIILAIVFTLSLIGCESSSDNVEVCKAKYPERISYEDRDAWQKIREENPVENEFKNSLNSFACNTASQILKDKNENIMYSPLSLYYALAIVADGSNGETQNQLLELLNVDNKDYLSQQCSNLYRLLYSDNEISKLKIANSLWLDNEIGGNKVSFKKDFIDNAKENFYASLFSVDFSDEKTGETIGKWISDNTNGTLEYDYNPSPEQIMSIINTIYFYD